MKLIIDNQFGDEMTNIALREWRLMRPDLDRASRPGWGWNAYPSDAPTFKIWIRSTKSGYSARVSER